MNIEMEKEFFPKVSKKIIQNREKVWRVKLPYEYSDFLIKYNGGIPVKKSFYVNNHMYAIIAFLSVLENFENNEYGVYDIDVVLSKIEDRLTDNEDLIGCELLPVAELFGGDYLCLNFKNNVYSPSICIWKHDESSELAPVTLNVSESFSEFIKILK